MKRVAEIMYIVEEKREEFLDVYQILIQLWTPLTPKRADARAMLDGRMRSYSVKVDTSFDEDDWTGTIRI